MNLLEVQIVQLLEEPRLLSFAQLRQEVWHLLGQFEHDALLRIDANEVGYAQALAVPTILLFTSKDEEQMPFDVSGQRAIFYEDSIGGKSAVERDLRRHVESVLSPS